MQCVTQKAIFIEEKRQKFKNDMDTFQLYKHQRNNQLHIKLKVVDSSELLEYQNCFRNFLTIQTSNVDFIAPSSSATSRISSNNTFQTKPNLFLITLLHHVVNFLLNHCQYLLLVFFSSCLLRIKQNEKEQRMRINVWQMLK